MNVTWVSRPIAEDRPSEQELFGEFYDPTLETLVETITACREHSCGTPRSERAVHADLDCPYQLTDYLERLGVEVIFGLCGHTIIAVLDALAKSTHPLRQRRGTSRSPRMPPTATRARPERPASLLTHLGPGPDQRRDRRRQRGARLDSDGGDRRRHAVALLRPASAPGSQPAPGRRPVSRSTGRSASASTASNRARSVPRDHRAGVPRWPRAAGPARCWSTCRWTSSPRSRRRAVRRAARQYQDAGASPSLDDDDRGEIVARARRSRRRPVLYVGGGVLLGRRRRASCATLAEQLDSRSRTR